MTTPANPADLLAFLRAQLAARERAAHLIKQHGLANLLPAAIINSNGATVFFTDEAYTLISDHLDPDALLADVDAKRRIIGEFLRYEEAIDGEWGDGHTAEEIAAGECPERHPDNIPAFRALALPFADREGFREEWRPA